MAQSDTYFTTLQELGLERQAIELDVDGYTVIPPEKVAPPEFTARMTAAVLRVMEERTGVTHSLDRNGELGSYPTEFQLGANQFELWYLLFEDQVFEDWLDNETLVAFSEYCMRGQGQLSSLMAFVKWKSPEDADGLTFPLHCDAQPIASPEGRLPLSHDLVMNTALLLSDYTHDNGAIVMVPGSHKFGRMPLPNEAVEKAVAVEAKAGSLLVWHGTTWHGAVAKKTDGLRLCVNAYFVHRTLKTQERYQSAVPDEMLARHGARFARYVGADDPMGWGRNGPEIMASLSFVQRTADATS